MGWRVVGWHGTCSSSGISIISRRGIRRSTASSKRSGRFVVPTTSVRLAPVVSPSHAARNSLTSEASWWPLGESERAESSESISSSTMTDGASSSAAAKTLRISFSDSPYHFDATTARVNEMK